MVKLFKTNYQNCKLLDVTFRLRNHLYQPFNKPDDILLDIHTFFKKTPNIMKQILSAADYSKTRQDYMMFTYTRISLNNGHFKNLSAVFHIFVGKCLILENLKIKIIWLKLTFWKN